MKALILLALFASSPAFAFVGKGLYCKEIGSGIDNGFQAIVSENFKKAVISEQSIAGPQSIAELACAKAAEETVPGADQIVAVASCSEPEKRDTGFALTIEAGGIAGLTTATLTQVTFGGANTLAKLNCHYLNSARK